MLRQGISSALDAKFFLNWDTKIMRKGKDEEKMERTKNGGEKWGGGEYRIIGKDNGRIKSNF